jgi:hypothetical protein
LSTDESDVDDDNQTGEDAGEEIVFELSDWTEDDRQALHQKLTTGNIPHSWEEGDLVVDEADADVAEQAIEAVEYPDELAIGGDGDDEDDDGAGYELMSTLFVAADRLQHDPDDPVVGGEFEEASDAVVAGKAPYGVAPELWKQVQELAHNVCEELDEAEPEVIARDAATLRQLLSRYV